ncbi:phosphomannomutase [Talaromyces islandicus]|uniref:Phosphomannomutase n=1 Tax=Talaromyces islandicus TaxID=28573 RepID=A0A0U1LX24_TALIS|nr:phosphomannomutase [Talaromyces islandicus]
MADQPDYYKVLGIAPSATQQQIRDAYKRASLKTHPDRVSVDSPERASRTRQFQKVNDAYYTLSDQGRRREYDAARRDHFAGEDDTADEEVPRGAGAFPWSTFGFGGSEQERQGRDSDQFGSVFEEMLREEGLATDEADGQSVPTKKFWSIVGAVSGGALGFIVANVPGALAGAVAGNRLGAVRDAKGKIHVKQQYPSPHPSFHRLRVVRNVVIPDLFESVLQHDEIFPHTIPTMATAAASVYPSLENRPIKDTVCLFDVDETLSPARQPATAEMQELLSQLRHKCAIGYISGSDFAKQQEQLGSSSVPVTSLFDFCFAENGLNAFRLGKPLASTSFIEWLGEEKYQNLVNFTLRYLADIRLPRKRGTFIEFRKGMINISPVGRNATIAERNEFEEYDNVHNVRKTLVEALKKEFPDYGLTYSIGGKISFDVFPTGWDKTYCLRHLEAEKESTGVEYKNIHFFGDKCMPGGNDYEIFSDSRTIGHSVDSPEHTMKLLRELFELS